MTDKQEIFEKVNEMLENTGLNYEINSTSSLEEFLENEDNQLLEEYEMIESLYSELLDIPYYDEDE